MKVSVISVRGFGEKAVIYLVVYCITELPLRTWVADLGHLISAFYLG